jgi:hypothetical protein
MGATARVSAPPSSPDVAAYYRDPAVRRRLHEYCGAGETETHTAVYVATLRDDSRPHLTWDRSTRIATARMDTLFEDRGDLSRSLWDTRHLLFVVDLDYQNIDAPSEPFTHPADTFLKVEPTYRATREALAELGLEATDVMTGRGYHFIGRVPLRHPVVDLLASLLPAAPAWYRTYELRRPPTLSAVMTAKQASASTALGLLLEDLAHDVLRRASSSSSIPVVVNGTVVGSGALGRECVSIDFSHAGDPLDIRHIRLAFGAYQWHRFRPDIFGAVAASFPPLVALPRRGRPLFQMLARGRGLDAGLRAAKRSAPMVIPDISNGLERLLNRYVSSRLAAFHREFYKQVGTPAARPLSLDSAALPPCLSACLQQPNDLLLRPEHLQYLTRGLIARGWQASQIATLVQSLYEADYGWGDRWTRMDARSRAEFDVRVFAGMLVIGVDRMIDHNCVSAQEKGVCPGIGCGYDLRLDRDHVFRGRS